MDVRIRPAKTAKECDLIGEMHHAACRDLTWTRHVDPKVDPNEAKRFQSSLAAAIRKQYHGIVLVAEKEGKMMGYLQAWQYGKGSLDPYKHKEVYPSMKGRHLPIWWSVHSQVNEVCTKIEAEMGSFLYIDKVVVSPGSQKQGVGRKLMRYTMNAAAEAYNMPIGLLAAPESLPFFRKLGLQPAGVPVVLVGDDKVRVGPCSPVFGEACSSTLLDCKVGTDDSENQVRWVNVL